jgi:hypothetical protein
MQLWKRKHETGQWVEVEAIDTMSMRSELPPFNMPAILLTGDHARSNLDGTDQNNPDGSAKTGNFVFQLKPSCIQVPVLLTEFHLIVYCSKCLIDINCTLILLF